MRPHGAAEPHTITVSDGSTESRQVSGDDGNRYGYRYRPLIAYASTQHLTQRQTWGRISGTYAADGRMGDALQKPSLASACGYGTITVLS